MRLFKCMGGHSIPLWQLLGMNVMCFMFFKTSKVLGSFYVSYVNKNLGTNNKTIIQGIISLHNRSDPNFISGLAQIIKLRYWISETLYTSIIHDFCKRLVLCIL